MRAGLSLRLRSLDLQSKIIVTLVLVIVPTFLVVNLAQYKFARPILEEEWKQVGIAAGERLALRIVTNRWYDLANPTQLIEAEISRLAYQQPSVHRIDVFLRDPVTGNGRLVGSNVEEEGPVDEALLPALVDDPVAMLGSGDDEERVWDIRVPIWLESRTVRPRANKGKPLGMVRVVVSTRSVQRLLEAFWKITFFAAIVTVFTLIFFLNYFLRRTLANERRLRQAETQNLELFRQLHETQRQLLTLEKFAVMGQLTANFAHEIGTPLNAISLHLQLLRTGLVEPASGGKPPLERLDIVSGEVGRIERIVANFLHSTAKPPSQPQLTDLNEVVEKTLAFLRPRLDALGVLVDKKLDRQAGPLRVVPLDLEQVLLNLLNNALDSMGEKAGATPRYRPSLVLVTSREREGRGEQFRLVVRDNGLGIARENLKNVMKPFFTTKGPGQGTGLGLAICQQILARYAGTLSIDSRQGAWAKVQLDLPYQGTVQGTS